MPTKLSASQVAKLTEDGDHQVDRNLQLHIRNGGTSKAWVFRYRFNGRLRRMGLGPLRLVTYSNAIRKAVDYQKLLNDGVDPMEHRDAARQVSTMTFAECATAYIGAHKASWQGKKQEYVWTQTIEAYANPVIGKLPVDKVTANDVVKILEPIWSTKSVTAGKLRGRIESVLDWARVSGYRSGENPAKWHGELEHRLPSLSKVHEEQHHEAIPYADMPGVYAKLAAKGGTVANALMLIALTAVRTGEALGATWDEFDLDAAVWMVPAARMKMRKEHRVPLAPAAVALLKAMRGEAGRGLLFPSRIRSKAVVDQSLRKLLRMVGPEAATTHGLRSTFRDWAADRTSYPREVAEAALAHIVGSKVERAYFRSDQFDQRAKLMADWASYLGGVVIPPHVQHVMAE